MFLIDDILLAPARGILFIFREIHKQVMAEYYSRENIYDKLRRLQYQFEIGEIDEKRFSRQQKALFDRIDEIVRYEEELEEDQTNAETEVQG